MSSLVDFLAKFKKNALLIFLRRVQFRGEVFLPNSMEKVKKSIFVFEKMKNTSIRIYVPLAIWRRKHPWTTKFDLRKESNLHDICNHQLCPDQLVQVGICLPIIPCLRRLPMVNLTQKCHPTFFIFSNKNMFSSGANLSFQVFINTYLDVQLWQNQYLHR